MMAIFREWFVPWRAYLAEFLGTFVFVLTAAGASLVNEIYGEIGTVGVALATGLAIMVGILATVGISGGHLNPAVTLALWLGQKVKGSLAFFYIGAQLTASVAAAGLLLFIFEKVAVDFSLGGPAIAAEITPQAALVIEAVMTAALVLVVFATMVDKRGPVSFGPAAVGLVVLVAYIFAGPLTGAALNPARAFGPAIVAQSWDNLIVWIVGPAAGALFGIIYDFLFLRKGKK